jgi:hypothetical protein
MIWKSPYKSYENASYATTRQTTASKGETLSHRRMRSAHYELSSSITQTNILQMSFEDRLCFFKGKYRVNAEASMIQKNIKDEERCSFAPKLNATASRNASFMQNPKLRFKDQRYSLDAKETKKLSEYITRIYTERKKMKSVPAINRRIPTYLIDYKKAKVTKSVPKITTSLFTIQQKKARKLSKLSSNRHSKAHLLLKEESETPANVNKSSQDQLLAKKIDKEIAKICLVHSISTSSNRISLQHLCILI